MNINQLFCSYCSVLLAWNQPNFFVLILPSLHTVPILSNIWYMFGGDSTISFRYGNCDDNTVKIIELEVINFNPNTGFEFE